MNHFPGRLRIVVVMVSLVIPQFSLAEQAPLRPVQRQPSFVTPSRLIPPRPMTITKESLESLARTPMQHPRHLQSVAHQTLDNIAHRIKKGETRGAQDQWTTLLTELKRSNVPADINELIQYVLREAYLQTYRDLQYYAEKVKHYNDQKERIRSELNSLRDQLQRAGAIRPPQPPPAISPAQLSGKIKHLESQLSSVGDDAQLANIDLQNKLQQQQQTVQMLSNVSKMLHDTALAIIRKIG